MSVEERNYKFEVLEYAVNQSIYRLLPNNNEEALSVILYQCNEVVWRVATEIYTKSGHQVDFSFIRDVLILKIEPLRKQIAEEDRIRQEKEAEEARIQAELEAQRLAKQIEEERIRKEQRAKIESEKLAKKANQEKIRREKEAEEAKLRKQKEEAKQQKLQQFIKVNSNINIDIFLRIEKIIIEELMVEEKQITLNSILSKDLGADDLDVVELIQVIEKEFDIEIPDNFTGTHWISCICGDYSRLQSITVKEIIDIVCEKIQHKH